MKRFWLVVLVSLSQFLFPPPSLQASGPLVELARPGPWAGVSGLIAYGSRLYLVNSQIFVNHNAADIYSYHPGTRTLRFEHRLFSQDAGRPAVIDGLLYWPYEDPRFSTTHGEYEITNGLSWQWRVASEIRGFHLHAMTGHQGAFYALASGWRGRVYRSTDNGQHWQQVYEHPTPEGSVSRLTSLVSLDATLYFALTAWREDGVKLLRTEAGTIGPVPGWPAGRSIGALAAFRGRIYAVNRTDQRRRLWRTAGDHHAEPVKALDGYTVYALADTPEALWAVSDDTKGGRLWKSTDGLTWQTVQRLPSVPVAITVVNDQVFVGTYDTKYGGALWGPASSRPWGEAMPQTELPVQPVHRLEPDELKQALRDLDNTLADGDNPTYRHRLLARLLPLALTRDSQVGPALSKRLRMPLPQTPVSLIGGQVKVPASRLAQWYLLHAIALNGHGNVPLTLFTRPWTASPNRAEKYLEPIPAAAWAATQLGQADADTLAALELALRGDLPSWVRGDVLAALHTLGARAFAYDGQ